MKTEPMTPAEFDQALAALAWKGTDFCDRAGLVPNTVWRWRKGHVDIPRWVGEYLRAMLAVQRLHSEFVAVTRGAERAPTVMESGADSSAAEAVQAQSA